MTVIMIMIETKDDDDDYYDDDNDWKIGKWSKFPSVGHKSEF